VSLAGVPSGLPSDARLLLMARRRDGIRREPRWTRYKPWMQNVEAA
jgi:hypothetical protein